uniref:Methyltransferase domain-containing protein n=1 Tax=Phaeocystis antarctica TaxID=33657 RepID=A0A7S0HMP6_9EUKA
MTSSTAPQFDAGTYREGLRVSPAFQRNKQPILEALQRRLPKPPPGATEPLLVLEAASGPGEHAAHWAAEFGPAYTFQPTELDADALDSIRLYAQGLANVAPPLVLDTAAAAEQWPVEPASCDAIVAINLCHIAPKEASRGLLRGAARALRPGGRLCVYGPFLIDGRPTSDSNAAFDASLQARDPSWGIRDVAALDSFGAPALRRVGLDEMPANNFLAVWERQP